MEISLNLKNGWVVVDLNGRVDSFNFELITEQITTLEKMGKKFIAIEMSDVNFLNLPSLRFFSSIAFRLKKSDGALALINPSSNLMEFIHLFNRKEAMTIVADVSSLSKRDKIDVEIPS